jgi:hypothetical protein
MSCNTETPKDFKQSKFAFDKGYTVRTLLPLSYEVGNRTPLVSFDDINEWARLQENEKSPSPTVKIELPLSNM